MDGPMMFVFYVPFNLNFKWLYQNALNIEISQLNNLNSKKILRILCLGYLSIDMFCDFHNSWRLGKTSVGGLIKVYWSWMKLKNVDWSLFMFFRIAWNLAMIIWYLAKSAWNLAGIVWYLARISRYWSKIDWSFANVAWYFAGIAWYLGENAWCLAGIA